METGNETLDSEDGKEDETTDNLVEGVIQDVSTEGVEETVGEVLFKCRQLITMIRKSTMLTAFVNATRAEINQAKTNKITRNLSLDVRNRWNSICYLLETLMMFGDILNALFRAKTTYDITTRKREKLTTCAQ
ncbi:unnamed protein product [Didymodactylos carnosus]|uniref:Uncharacterized protein n=1 Tax=Didymodactylos carnosus TaxID=1234261 RepID=A0A815M9C6_9BILA|nr:unnamed protein product [Didymodactylos carnosus]CAF4304194.1 unnamed protein product [Didymodactylos carnosus]